MNKYCKGKSRSGIDLHTLGHKFFLKGYLSLLYKNKCSHSKWKLKTSLLFRATFVFDETEFGKNLNKDYVLPLSGMFLFSEFEISQVSETLLRACPS